MMTNQHTASFRSIGDFKMKRINSTRGAMSNFSMSEMSTETQASSDRNHPVLARMMRALKSQRKSSSHNIGDATQSEQLFVSKKSFAASNNKLFGRQSQLKQLHKLFDQLSHQSSNGNASFLALVHGKSGSGKSSLVDAFVKTFDSRPNSSPILFTAGKFDQLKTHLPYASLIKAANDLARKALKSPHAERIKTRLLDELGPDIRLLATIVEELSILLSREDNVETNASSKKIGLAGKAITRFKLLLRSFIRSIATRDAPVVMFFDDLQWADDATMEMLKALLMDKLANNVMLILAYREDEMNTEKLHKFFSVSALDDESQQQLSSYLTNIVHRTEIEVPDLDLHALNQMVSAVLNMDPESTISLTDIIMNKTQGNPFYALNFMDMLHAEDMLQQTHDNLWEWNESIILQQTDVSDNLAKILENKILRLPEKVKSILQLAAFIGHDFAPGVLTTIVHEEQDMIEGEYSFDLFDKTVIQQWIVDALNLALGEGLVETSTTAHEEGEVTYKFSHDKIQHCLYKDLMPDDVERRLLHQRIGKLIWNTISSQDYDTVDDWILFLAADNLNRGPKFVDDDGDRVEMVELNVRAAKLAASKAAFLVGVEYLRCGEKLITNDSFVENNYDLCMDLWCVASDMERIVGEFERSNELAKKIHKHARQIEDEFPAYLTEIKTLAIQGNLTNAMALAFKVLKQMGEKFPKRISILTVVQEFIRTKLIIGGRKPDDLMELPLLMDKKKLFALKLLSSISGYAYIAGESAKFTFVAVGLRMASLTMRCGLSAVYAPQAFLGYGTMCCFFGNVDLGLSFGDAAQRLFARFDAESSIQPRAQLHHLSFIRPWRLGVNETLGGSFLQVYHNCMLVGDVDFAFIASSGWLYCAFNGAVPLDELVTKGTRFRLEMEEYGEKSMLHLMIPTLQAARIMLGDKSNRNPAVLSGEDMDLEDFTATIKETKSITALFALVVCEVTIAIYFGDWESVNMKISILEQVIASTEGYFTFPINLTSLVWSCYRLYDITGKKRHRQIGRRHHRTLKRYAKLKSPIAITSCKVLKAAKAAYVKKKPVEECEELFVSALQDLENTRNYWVNSYVADELAELFLKKAKNVEKGMKYLNKSLGYSAGWGAQEKVRFLERKISAIRPV